MSTSGISLASGIAPAANTFQNTKNRIQEDFTQISQSLQSNNLTGAQQAYADLTQATPGIQASANPIQNDLATLGQALQSGSLSSSQTAFSKLQTDLSNETQGTQQTGHHHHRHHTSSADSTAATALAAASSTAATTSTAASTGTNFLGTLIKTGLSLLA